jgi:hypothetical protein
MDAMSILNDSYYYFNQNIQSIIVLNTLTLLSLVLRDVEERDDSMYMYIYMYVYMSDSYTDNNDSNS